MVEDSGEYTCQVTHHQSPRAGHPPLVAAVSLASVCCMSDPQSSGHPPTSITTILRVLEAYATIMGSKVKVFRAGSEMQLVCTIRDITAVPTYVFWYHNSRMINYDAMSGVEVRVAPLVSRTLRSTLTVANVTLRHSGNFSCCPSQVIMLPTIILQIEFTNIKDQLPVMHYNVSFTQNCQLN